MKRVWLMLTAWLHRSPGAEKAAAYPIPEGLFCVHCQIAYYGRVGFCCKCGASLVQGYKDADGKFFYYEYSPAAHPESSAPSTQDQPTKKETIQ